jgi:hypothetical protein
MDHLHFDAITNDLSSQRPRTRRVSLVAAGQLDNSPYITRRHSLHFPLLLADFPLLDSSPILINKQPVSASFPFYKNIPVERDASSSTSQTTTYHSMDQISLLAASSIDRTDNEMVIIRLPSSSDRQPLPVRPIHRFLIIFRALKLILTEALLGSSPDVWTIDGMMHRCNLCFFDEKIENCYVWHVNKRFVS